MRLDQYLVHKGLVSSRTQAQDLIKQGGVILTRDGDAMHLLKPNTQVLESDIVEVLQEQKIPYVSRGGLKLKGALEKTDLSVAGWVCLDIGLSTGGFSDCLLQAGARQVVGVDVGTGQLHKSLQADQRLLWFDKVNARNLSQHEGLMKATPKEGFDLIVMDVSFISMTLLLSEVYKFLQPKGHFLGLVKPQFEVGPEGLGKGGLVKDPQLYQGVRDRIETAAQSAGLKVFDFFSSPIEGKDGNREFFIYLRK